MIKIHGVNVSPFVRKVRVALAEKGIEYDLVAANPFAPSDEFLRISPLKKIPVLQDGEVILPDSSAIVAYLEKAYPTSPLYPTAAAEYGRALFYEEYADTLLYSTLAPIFVQRVVVPNLMNGTPDEKIIQASLTKVPEVLSFVESLLGDGDWLVGDSFTIADIAMSSPFVNFGYAGESVDAQRYPKLAAYVARAHARPSFKALIDEEQAGLGV